MHELLNQADTALFMFINRTLSNPVTDVVMPFITDLNQHRIVLIAVVALVLWMLIRGGRTARLAILCLVVAIALSDQFSSAVLKGMVARMRPCHVLPDVHLLVGCGGGLSFPSSHAVNTTTAALILAFFFPRWRWWFAGFAVIVGLSRIVVGVHYPADVVGGAAIGLIIGSLVLWSFVRIENWWTNRGSAAVRRTL